MRSPLGSNKRIFSIQPITRPEIVLPAARFRNSIARDAQRITDPAPRNPATSVYAIYGVEPEVQAYAMAKYSRSALSMKESLREISEQKAEKFLNTYYFQYGHRSIADLAHIAMAIERLSILAAIAVVDEQRWDGQERSTRYQDFSHPDYYLPEFGGSGPAQHAVQRHHRFSFRRVSGDLGAHVPPPAGAHAASHRHEAGGVRPHPARPRLRRRPLPAAAGHQHFAGADRQCAHPGEPDLAPALRSASPRCARWGRA